MLDDAKRLSGAFQVEASCLELWCSGWDGLGSDHSCLANACGIHINAAFEHGAIFQQDAGCDHIAVYIARLGNNHFFVRRNVANYLAIDLYHFGEDVGTHLTGLADGNLIAIQADLAFNLALNQQVFFAGNFTFDNDAWSYHCRSPHRNRGSRNRLGLG
jgi:hypothetical protein